MDIGVTNIHFCFKPFYLLLVGIYIQPVDIIFVYLICMQIILLIKFNFY